MNTARAETTRLADLLRREHHAMAEFLVALSAFDRDRRWEELGYATLFDFLRRELKLSAGAAQYRKTAAELLRKYPDVEPALRRGDLCLSSVNHVAKVLTPENAAEVLPRFFGKSAREAELVAASIRPVEHPPLRDFLVTPLRANPSVATPVDATTGALRTSEVTSSGASATAGPAQASAAAARDRPRFKPLDAERARVNMTVSRRLLDKLAAARDALSHSHPGASEETILELGLDLIIDRHRKRRGIGAKPRKRSATARDARAMLANANAPLPRPLPPLRRERGAIPTPTATPTATTTGTAVSSPPPVPPPPSGRGRYVAASVWRAVWGRDQGCCAWPLENGGVCGATYQLELDHIGGWALGAGTSVDECRLLCRRHNLRHARELFGATVMDRYTCREGGRCSEPVAVYLPAGGNGPRSSAAARSSAPTSRARDASGVPSRAPREGRSATSRGPEATSRAERSRRSPTASERPSQRSAARRASRGGTPRRRRRPWARRPRSARAARASSPA